MTIQINGPIIQDSQQRMYDYFKMPATSPSLVTSQLPSDDSDIDVEINSNGGYIDAGSSIYTALKAYKGKVTVKIVGMAASAASVIAMAGDKVLMSPTAQMMIHNVRNVSEGDYQEHTADAKALESMTKGMATAYVDKTGKPAEEIQQMMDRVTFMNAKEALENGFIDEIMFTDVPAESQLVASAGGLLSNDTLSMIQKEISNQEQTATPVFDFKALLERLDGIEAKLETQINNNEERTAENVNNSKPFVF